MIHYRRLPLMAMAMIGLVLAMWGGLQRIGVNLPALLPALPLAHGPLMLGGFLGTLISLERAVARTAGWGYAAPLFCGVGGLGLIAGLPPSLPALLITLGSLVLVLIFASFLRQHPGVALATMTLGAVSWLAGNLLWLSGRPLYQVVFFWAGFLIFTIAGERLELSKILRMTRFKQVSFWVALAVMLAGMLLSPLYPDVAVRGFGAGMLLLAGWLYRYDIARISVRKSGLTRYIGVCLLSGYFWLIVCGLTAIYTGAVAAGPVYDALLHAAFLGFVFSMIFGHAPVIFPAILGVPVPFRNSFYSHLLLLQLSLALRLAGDLLNWYPGRHWGAIGNVAAIVLFLVNTVISVVRKQTTANPELSK